ncbi:citrate synthase [Streptoalloteichus tenebrarius]|uniref:Citrate synthase n=1 Tax=Streptoalloteichus tenebrarius (strain ATCC 17920 / DSM 40477 / JCM 4838 / CBS 697.72 / NBRC 16177 / NCIMB 11028 / NRRL B-12390 / A12253. 1 / ISP 5477) TaxID=1933 RepID=A0ABT1I3Z6_STRSD|nr:citrate synthase [Streptoalloteichus tenebrarius]MCP2262464.1 citrate synthase [Streptoalloteichus tenebrarius]BFF01338.1 citrate synthase [Streptoalloteichus tenebrarius]
MPDATPADRTVALRHEGGEHEMSVTPATDGAPGIDLGKLLAKTGMVTLDPGFVNTASCSSAITYIDGDAGILRYRGYPIEQLAESSTFVEVSYLLIYGELPTQAELDDFTDKIRRHTLLHEDLKRFFDGFPRDAHPMPVLSSAVSALSTFYQDSLNPFDDPQVEMSTIRLLAKLPTIAAYAYKKSVGQPFLYPDNSLGLVENFLRMTFGFPAEPYKVDPILTKALDQLFILHADHEQNCSTSTVRLVGSSQANMFASISAGINALFGPLHGGANQAVLEMLEGIRDSGGDVDTFVRKVKNKEDGVKLMGFGHRVYKNYDPRAAIIKKTADEVLGKLGGDDQLLGIAKALEERALSDDYFVERKLYPNVDFYTGLIYRAMGFPTRMFTVLFALGRLPGWIAHWREMMKDPATKIGRPRQVYVGSPERDYVAISER